MFGLLNTHLIAIDNIQRLHYLFYKNIDEDNAGIWRDVNIFITGSDYELPHPNMLGGLMNDLIQWVNNERDKMHPVQFAALLHLKFVTIHPFIDGNGRVARLLMNAALIQDGHMLAVVPPILRHDYISLINAYQKTGDAEPFCDFIAERVLQTEKDVIRLLHITPI
jgi:Fic family protein